MYSTYKKLRWRCANLMRFITLQVALFSSNCISPCKDRSVAVISSLACLLRKEFRLQLTNSSAHRRTERFFDTPLLTRLNSKPRPEKIFNKKSRSYYGNSLCKSVGKMVLHAAALEARRSIAQQTR